MRDSRMMGDMWLCWRRFKSSLKKILKVGAGQA